jgi:hypothetical protein
MSRTASVFVVSIAAALLSFARVAAAESPGEAEPAPPPSGEMPPPAVPAAPAPPGEGAPAGAAPVVVPSEAVSDDGSPLRPADLSYGVSARLRWVSVPKFMLNPFTKQNVPLSSWATGFEFFRRKGNFDLIASFSYINLSPPDGNWLGDRHDAAVDTDLVQFRGLALYGLDVSFVWHTRFTDWFGMHYGAGIGVGIVGGKILRTSNANCTEENAGDLSQCHPVNPAAPTPGQPGYVRCTSTGCNEQDLAALPRAMDSSVTPSRFAEPNVPPVLPIVNLVVGMNFRLPQLRGWEAKIEGGFHETFFLGGGIGYTF